MYEDKAGNIWLGTVYNSLRILDRESGLIASPEKGPVSKNPAPGERIVNAILQDSSGNYWIGTRTGVYFSQSQSYSIKRILYRIKDVVRSTIYGNIFSLLIDHHGRIWFGGDKGSKSVLLKYNKVSNTFDSTAFPLNEVRQNSGTGVWKFLEDSKHRIWIGTTNGVFLVAEPSEKITHFFYKADDPSSLSHDETWTIFEDHSGNIWIGTMGGGLNLWNQQTGNFAHFMQDQGLAGNIVSGILEDEQNNLWISTNNGISKFNPGTKVFRNYLTPEIRNVGQFNTNASLKTKDGFMLFGGQNGIIRFHHDSIREDHSHAPIMITSFSVLGKEIRNEIGHGEEISIPYKDNYFSMEFAALDYRDSPKLQYAYELEGVNNSWVNAGTQRFCSYSNLSPGDYLFRIKAANSYGVWNEKGISILIHIIPPIYLTSWFKWSVGVLMLLLIVGLVYWRIDFVQRKELNKRRMVESELQALRLQMNPHFIFNSLNAIQNFVINTDAEKATEYLSKFAKLMRMILENSKQQTIPLKDEIEFLRLYLEIESVRFEERFDYEIQVDPALPGDFGIPSMLLQPYIENAIRHGLLHRTSRGNLNIKLALLDDTIVASIKDDGIGRKKAMEIKERQGHSYKAFGMEITHDRLKILNSFRKKEMKLNIIDLYDELGEPNGTQIDITIPV
jgi:streptogramin lyase